MSEVANVAAPLRGMDGADQGTVELPVIFAERPREHLLFEVVQMQQASRRAGTHSTKTRGEVSGGGIKPWRQKGTGRARAGSIRSPIWEGGGTTFGPRPRDYSYRLPAKARRVALCAALSDRQRGGTLTVIEEIKLPEAKTRRVAAMLSALGLEGTVLIVESGVNGDLEKAARNLPRVKVLRTEGVNVYDVLRHQHLLITRNAVAALAERLAK